MPFLLVISCMCVWLNRNNFQSMAKVNNNASTLWQFLNAIRLALVSRFLYFSFFSFFLSFSRHLLFLPFIFFFSVKSFTFFFLLSLQVYLSLICVCSCVISNLLTDYMTSVRCVSAHYLHLIFKRLFSIFFCFHFIFLYNFCTHSYSLHLLYFYFVFLVLSFDLIFVSSAFERRKELIVCLFGYFFVVGFFFIPFLTKPSIKMSLGNWQLLCLSSFLLSFRNYCQKQNMTQMSKRWGKKLIVTMQTMTQSQQRSTPRQWFHSIYIEINHLLLRKTVFGIWLFSFSSSSFFHSSLGALSSFSVFYFTVKFTHLPKEKKMKSQIKHFSQKTSMKNNRMNRYSARKKNNK